MLLPIRSSPIHTQLHTHTPFSNWLPIMQASHSSRVSIQPLGTPGCLAQNVHDRRASAARPGDRRRVNELTKVEALEDYGLFKPHGHVDRSLYFR